MPVDAVTTDSPVSSNPLAAFPAPLLKAVTEIESGVGSSSDMDHRVREARMGDILQGRFYDLDDAFLDHIIADVDVPLAVRRRVLRSDEWTVYTSHTGVALSNNERQNQAIALITRIVETYRSCFDSNPLRKEYVDSSGSEVRYHTSSVAPLVDSPERVANKNLKPDMYSRLIPAFQSRGDIDQPWAEVEMMWELKSNKNKINDSSAVFWPTALKAAALLQDQFGYRRTHVLAALLCGNLFRLAVYDRCGGGVTPAFDIKENPDRFISCTIAFLTVDERRLGLVGGSAADTFSLSLGGKNFVVAREPIRVAPYDHLISRGTTCWRATWAPGYRPTEWPDATADPWPLLLKAAWQYDGRKPEWTFLETLNDERGIPELIGHGNSWTTDGADSTRFSRDHARALHAKFRPKRQVGASPTSSAGKSHLLSQRLHLPQQSSDGVMHTANQVSRKSVPRPMSCTATAKN